MGVVLLRRIVIAVIVIIGLVAAAWFWGLPRYRPEISDDQMFGLDVSSLHGDIEWELVRSSNIGFAYLRATEGTSVDTAFDRNRSMANEAGLRTGPSHDFSACVPGAEQAASFVAIAAPEDADGSAEDSSLAPLPPALFLRESASCIEQRSTDQVFSEVEGFVTTVEAAFGRPLVIYERGAFGYLDALTAERRRWRRSLFQGPVEADWAIWQFHNRARIAGIGGLVTLNIANVDQLRE